MPITASEAILIRNDIILNICVRNARRIGDICNLMMEEVQNPLQIEDNYAVFVKSHKTQAVHLCRLNFREPEWQELQVCFVFHCFYPGYMVK